MTCPHCGFENTPRALFCGRCTRDITAEGKRRRDIALEQVRSHTPSEYQDAFEAAVAEFVSKGQDFTSEDVTAIVGMPPNNPNAVGALTRSSAIRYGCVKVSRTKATRPGQHASEIAVWGVREAPDA